MHITHIIIIIELSWSLRGGRAPTNILRSHQSTWDKLPSIVHGPPDSSKHRFKKNSVAWRTSGKKKPNCEFNLYRKTVKPTATWLSSCLSRSVIHHSIALSCSASLSCDRMSVFTEEQCNLQQPGSPTASVGPSSKHYLAALGGVATAYPFFERLESATNMHMLARVWRSKEGFILMMLCIAQPHMYLNKRWAVAYIR